MNNHSQSPLEMRGQRRKSTLGTNGILWIAIQHRKALPDDQIIDVPDRLNSFALAGNL